MATCLRRTRSTLTNPKHLESTRNCGVKPKRPRIISSVGRMLAQQNTHIRIGLASQPVSLPVCLTGGVLLGPHTPVQERHEPARTHQTRRGPQQVHGEAVRLGQGTPNGSRKILLEPARKEAALKVSRCGGHGARQWAYMSRSTVAPTIKVPPVVQRQQPGREQARWPTLLFTNLGGDDFEVCKHEHACEGGPRWSPSSCICAGPHPPRRTDSHPDPGAFLPPPPRPPPRPRPSRPLMSQQRQKSVLTMMLMLHERRSLSKEGL